ncbi:hypothetical protein NE237_004846 [Protea cynaroides]|uniref:Glycosyltransferase n=1 Tax=Protea cynaroides TaxID=273540 RepID=A0A9Q0KJM3_9MAGN|nr:hypothetical protein NE237_004846 [Protea cynaroides]
MAQNNELHIVMFPWLAFDHMIPFLELSKGLAQRGHRISFISTPRNIERLPKLARNLSSLITFGTSDVPLKTVQYLKKAFDGLEEPFVRFVESSDPNWIIHDFAHHWVPPIAAKFGVPSVFFCTFNDLCTAFFDSPWVEMTAEDTRTEKEQFAVPPKWIPSPSNLAFRRYEILEVFLSLSENASGVGSKFVVLRSCEDFEGDYLSILREKLYQIPVIPVGLLPPLEEDPLGNSEVEWINIKNWLDKQREGSMVYVTCGTEAELSREEMHEVALGLELSGLPFFWRLKRPAGSEGFIYSGWAPQRRILSHPSVGVFLTHYGWSSVIEGLTMGCPLVLFPLSADQPLVARLLVSKNIGVEIHRDEQDGSFTSESVANSLRLIIVESEGELHKAKAREMREVYGDKFRHDRYIDDFEWYLRNYGW